MKTERCDKCSVLRRQAYQRLEADEAAIHHFEDRLVVQFEAIMGHRVANHLLELYSRFELAVHFKVEELDAIAAIRLALVEGQIGAFQQPL
jgi:hypothetical protein